MTILYNLVYDKYDDIYVHLSPTAEECVEGLHPSHPPAAGPAALLHAERTDLTQDE